MLKILELCAGCKSENAAAAKEARETFGIERVEVFSLGGKPATDCTRCADILTYDWTCDEELRSFREEREEGVRYIYYAHASPPLRTVQFDGQSLPGPAVAAGLTMGGLGGAALSGAYRLFRPPLLDP